MEPNITFSIEECSLHYNVDQSFIKELRDYGLINVLTINTTPCIQDDDLALLEKYARMHYDMDINLPGIEVIAKLLSHINELNKQLNVLQNRVIVTDHSDSIETT